jgi:hypothetical protein
MPKLVMIDEIHLIVRAPRGLPVTEGEQMARTLNQPWFTSRLRLAVREVFRHYPSLRKAKIALER